MIFPNTFTSESETSFLDFEGFSKNSFTENFLKAPIKQLRKSHFLVKLQFFSWVFKRFTSKTPVNSYPYLNT